MNLAPLVIIALVLAAVPCALFFLNLRIYRPLPQTGRCGQSASAGSTAEPPAVFAESCGISVLIPARNEERNIRATLTAALASCNPHDEVMVLDDHSTDRTAEIVRSIEALDPRVRLESAPPLPAGWCGKQHACHVMARRARNPLLVFLDADVRLAPDALARMRAFMQHSGVALASGVPQQELGTFSERLLLPLIHFILLGFLPMHGMRFTRWASISAGCGQLFIVRREAYAACGGHARLKDSMHDGIKLPRVFRRAGFRTDLFDATDVTTCRMYHTDRETWAGLGKNATEGLAAPGTIGPMTALLLGGQVLPFALLGCAASMPIGARYCAALAAFLAYAPRVVAARLFRQSFGGALLHPLGVLALIAIQWHALIRHVLGRPAEWKGRRYGTKPPGRSGEGVMRCCLIVIVINLLLSCETGAADEPAAGWPKAPSCIELRDQFDTPQRLSFPAAKVTVLTIADRKGSEEVDGWIAALKSLYAARVNFRGLANVAGVPGLFQAKVRRKFQETRKYPVMMDWSGAACAQFGYHREVANILVINRDGSIRARIYGNASHAAVAAARAALEAALSSAETKGLTSTNP